MSVTQERKGRGGKRGQVKIILDLLTAMAHPREDIFQIEILRLQVTENPIQPGLDNKRDVHEKSRDA